MKYKITGEPRRELKKALHLYKKSFKSFWHYEESARVNGDGMSDDECNMVLLKLKKEIKDIEDKLKEYDEKAK